MAAAGRTPTPMAAGNSPGKLTSIVPSSGRKAVNPDDEPSVPLNSQQSQDSKLTPSAK